LLEPFLMSRPAMTEMEAVLKERPHCWSAASPHRGCPYVGIGVGIGRRDET
jgi:hypothetical protein